MVTRDIVLSAYRMILQREPESEAVIEESMAAFRDLDHIRHTFLHSDEFWRKTPEIILANRFQMDSEPECDIQVECSESDLRTLLTKIEETWSRLGEQDPYWSVLSREEFRRETFDRHQADYWQSGEKDVNRLLAWLGRSRVEPNPDWICLELGCGTGRITRWLSRRFRHVVGCDISGAHLALAKWGAEQAGLSGMEFRQVADLAAISDLPAYDILFSIMVLQHNPPPVIVYILDRLLERMKTGGIGYFQIPTYRSGYRFALRDYLADPLSGTSMEMHYLPQRHIFGLLRRHGCEVLEVQPDDKVFSLEAVSNTFLVRKPA